MDMIFSPNLRFKTRLWSRVLAKIAVAFVVLFATNPSQAAAQPDPICVERATIIERLQRRYGEHQISNGVNYNGVIIEVFTSQIGGFTILATRPDGESCLIASGDNWQKMPMLKADLGA